MPPTFVIPTPRSRWSDGLVHGLGDPLADARILDRTLADWRRSVGPDALPSSPNSPISGPALLVGEHLWLSPGAAEAFVKAAVGATGIVRLGRRADGPGGFADPLARLPRTPDGATVLFDVWHVPSGVSLPVLTAEGALPALLEDAETRDLTGRDLPWKMPIDPEITGEKELILPLSSLAVAPVGHWVELLRANLLAIAAEALRTPTARGVLSLLWAALRALSLNPYRVLQKLTVRGRKCQIHPSAVVEGCHLGDRVKVDAGAVLRGCWIGDDVEVGAQAIAEFTVIGHGARLQRRAVANMTVLYPGARCGGILQLGFMGEAAVTKMFAVGTDMRLGQAVGVRVPGGAIAEVDMRYQGVCIGHRAFVGSGVWIAPGRVIEADRRVVRDPALMVLT